MLSSLNDDKESAESFSKLNEEILYDFDERFTARVLDRIFSGDIKIVRQIEFSRYMNIAFSRIAITGVAAIVLLLISIFMMEGNLSFNSILGISDSQAESIVCLLTGN